jgi:hypothetical protein
LVKNVLPAHGQPQQLPSEQLDEQLVVHAELQLVLHGVLQLVLQLEEQEFAPTSMVELTAPTRSSTANRFFFNIGFPPSVGLD